MPVKNRVQLITYPDSLGGDLKALNHVLQTHLAGLFGGGVHILPPFPSSGDRGFAPLTYSEIEPAFGTWDDVRAIGRHHDILVDVMVNHISQRSPYFQDFLRHGRASRWADLFITLEKIWPDGRPVQADIDRMFLRRPRPYSTFTIADTGEQISVWTTFGKEDPSEQIDLDLRSPLTWQLLRDWFTRFSANGVKIVRLDAVGYVVKKLGTSCFFVEPEIWDVLDEIKRLADSLGIALLPEVHAPLPLQRKLAERGFWVYDFVLPFTVLSALLTGSGERLASYLKVCPHRQFTMLDCHDGIPVLPDLEGLIDLAEARQVVETCIARGSRVSRIVGDRHKGEGGFDVHQIGGTYYQVLGRDDDAYIAARAIQLFAPGVPQVYYVGLLAGENDEEAVLATGDYRAANRHNYTLAEIAEAVQKDVVQRLFRLIRFRNEYPAFGGEFWVLDAPAHEVRLQWAQGDRRCRLSVDLRAKSAEIDYVDDAGREVRWRA
ncbi:sucrose phosphorylase [Symbiobacterium terraclitae]|uniref:Sucrose phosphorylase n=1 Tax=Symbiobacterium terraclitae TaxID=557451 RepID=A0ABS4JMZ3_9FIRM|nr:sucrose phosphorylase [Symbiobacterium terraclitae]MBP2016899.1 sucrose phosphorylase [Symbiobacterium terraclitae]